MRNSLAIAELLIQDVDRGPPDMNMVKAVTLPLRTREEILWRQSTGFLWDSVVEICSVRDCHCPELWLSNIRPMNGSMKQHGSGDRDDGLDAAFG